MAKRTPVLSCLGRVPWICVCNGALKIFAMRSLQKCWALCSRIPVAECCQVLIWHQSGCNGYIVKQFILGSETLLRIEWLSFQQERTNKLKCDTREEKIGRKNRAKYLKRAKSGGEGRGGKARTGAGGVQGWCGIRGGLAYGFFQQAVLWWQAGDVTCWKAEVLQSSLQK